MKALISSALLIAVIPLAGCASMDSGGAYAPVGASNQAAPASPTGSPGIQAPSTEQTSDARVQYHYEVITDPPEEGSHFLALVPDSGP